MEDLFLLLGSAPANCAQVLRIPGWQIPFISLIDFQSKSLRNQDSKVFYSESILDILLQHAMIAEASGGQIIP
eukprot:UN12996